MSEAHIENTVVVGHATENLGTTSEGHGGATGTTAAHNENLKFALWLFLASEVVIFGVMIAAYIVFSIEHREVIHEVHGSRVNLLGFELPSVFLVALNTFMLLTSSWTMVMGLREAEHGNRKGVIQWLTYTAVLLSLIHI